MTARIRPFLAGVANNRWPSSLLIIAAVVVVGGAVWGFYRPDWPGSTSRTALALSVAVWVFINAWAKGADPDKLQRALGAAADLVTAIVAAFALGSVLGSKVIQPFWKTNDDAGASYLLLLIVALVVAIGGVASVLGKHVELESCAHCAHCECLVALDAVPHSANTIDTP